MNAHLYLRASTNDQDAERAKQLLLDFAQDNSLQVADVYAENISGTKLERPELARLLDSAASGDVLLVESVDRLSRLSQADWQHLKGVIKSKGLRLVVADLPTSHQLIADKGITGQIMDVINDMLIDLMATMARLDQEKRVERIKQGLDIKRARGEKVGGKGRNQKKWDQVADLLKRNGNTMEEIAKLAEVGVATVYRIKKEMNL
ncbi:MULTISPECIES: recombinase family protein [Pseudomonas]|uniref:Recombinase family protein n=1 Tax=Pseudomonas juntendi TaxID=2666183 RepID=A0A7W2LPD3_9PSED|nr:MULTISPECIES: recombinase family protein [Pseudomonas]MBA6144572.1 recombinase family protein [Pseudomonas juntendi]MDG9810615.1 recombinase family protein [Pseudomonas juntendi]